MGRGCWEESVCVCVCVRGGGGSGDCERNDENG